MNKILLFLFALGLTFRCSAQITETEPNDSIFYGNTVPINTVLSGQTCLFNEPDYFRIIVPQDGILRVHTTIAGQGVNPTTLLKFTLFNNNDPYNGFTPLAGNNGVSLNDSIEWCCLQADTFYLEVYTAFAFNYCYDYAFSWEIINPAFSNDVEPNSTFSNAIALPANTTKEGHLSFLTNPGLGGSDGVDFYKFSPLFNGTLKLYVESQAMSTGSNNLTVDIHNPNGSSWYTQQSPVGIYPGTSSDTLTWNCLAKDTLFFSIYTSNFFDRGYSYRIRYEMIPEKYADDIEPNNTFATAQFVNPTLPIEGNQIHGTSISGNQDDYFKFFKPDTGFLKIVAYAETQTSNTGGGNTIQLFDRNFNPIGAPFVAPIGTNGIPAVDSITYTSLPADSFYIKTYNTFAFASCRSYKLNLSFLQSSVGIESMAGPNIKLFPNPNNGNFNLDTKLLSGKAQVTIYDLFGRKIYDENIILGGITLLQLNQPAPASYVLQVIGDGIQIRKPLIIE
jgi:hypothetical protein